MGKPQVIVSLTSFPARMSHVSATVEPLLDQTVSPNRIILWLAKSEFASSSDCVPDELMDLEKDTIFEIRWVEESLRPHNKYYWAMREFPDDIIITVDDDTLYPLDMVERLLQTYYLAKRCVIANRTHLVSLDGHGDIADYRDWEFEQMRYVGVPRHDLLATGVGGVLYPPRLLPDDAFDRDELVRLCDTDDDAWLMAWEVLEDIPVVNSGSPWVHQVPGSQEVGLYKTNLLDGEKNDYLSKLYEAHPLFKEKLIAAVRAREEEERRELDELSSFDPPLL